MNTRTGIRKEFWEKGRATDCPIYDMHGHMGPCYGIYFPYPDASEMVGRMDRAGVKMLAFCHHATLMSGEASNLPNIEAVRKFPQRLRAYCGINPNFPETVEKSLKEYDLYKDVFIGFKFLSDYHKVAITDSRYREVMEFADSQGLPVLMHTWGGSEFDGERQVRKLAEKYHNAKLLLGHSCHGSWDESVNLAKDFPNIYLELCAVVDERSGILEKFVEKAGSERMLFGTDLPWFNYHYYIGAVLAADISEQDIRNIFYLNAENLFKQLKLEVLLK